MRSSHHSILLCHPAVALAYCCIAMVLAMAFIQPALSAIAFVAVASFGLLAFGVRSFAKRLLWQVPVVGGITALNCLFVQRGATVLLQVGAFSLHAESLLYGLSMGLALAATLELFALLGDVVPGDEAVAMMGRRFPSTGLLVSMALRLIPRMRRSAEERRDALKACTVLPPPEGRLKAASEEVSVMIANAMEDSLVTADSMRARGYGSGSSRTQYVLRRFTGADAGALTCVVALGALAFVAGWAASTGFAFYPRVSNGANGWESVAYAAFFLLPCAAYLFGLAKWRLAKDGA